MSTAPSLSEGAALKRSRAKSDLRILSGCYPVAWTQEKWLRLIGTRIAMIPESGCWVWLGCVDVGGYGVLRRNRVYRKAHRLAYELFKGPIPDGLTIDHLCRVRCCVNPGHLEAVTMRENTLRGKTLTAANFKKTHCFRGHELTPENTFSIPSNPRARICRECGRIRSREHYWKMRTEAQLVIPAGPADS